LASRGPESLLYPWGEEEPICDYVNMGGCLIPPDTQQVGHFLMGNSPDGVWDMSGNVWEWVHDWYADDYYAQSPTDNPIGPLEPQDPDKPLRVIRGGGLYSEPVRMRSASRLGINPYRPFDDVGFRCVTGEGLALPAAYDPGEDRHERVPPGSADGGDRAEDDPSDLIVYWSGDAIGPCPDFEGRIRLIFAAGSRPPAALISSFIRFPDWHFDIPCDYNEAAGLATCEGLAPPGYLDPPLTFPMDICFATPEWEGCVFGVSVLKPTDCFDDASWLTVDIRSGCVDTVPHAAIAIRIVPPDAPFESASADDIPLDCDPLPDEDGYYICSGLPGSPGEELDVDVIFADGMTRSGTVLYPPCPEGSFTPMMGTDCVEIGGVNTPVVSYRPPLGTGDLIQATANATVLTCDHDPATGRYECHGIPGDAGDPIEVTFTFDDRTSATNGLTIPACDGTVDFDLPWDLVQVGCTDTGEYYAVIETHHDYDFTDFSFESVPVDIPEPKDCGLVAGRPSRWYCSFPINDWYSTLTFCAEIDGTGEYCETFAEEEFGAMLPPRARCSGPDDDGPDDGGGDDDSLCSSYNQTDCTTVHANQCIWENGACNDR